MKKLFYYLILAGFAVVSLPQCLFGQTYISNYAVFPAGGLNLQCNSAFDVMTESKNSDRLWVAGTFNDITSTGTVGLGGILVAQTTKASNLNLEAARLIYVYHFRSCA
ncbi:MAG: hypothetical protein ACKVTZ_01700 [Bacteroidia bacterium]